MNEKYKHKITGRIYEVIKGEDFQDFTIKQSSKDSWESVVAYMDCETFQPFLTGKERFEEKFELIN